MGLVEHRPLSHVDCDQPLTGRTLRARAIRTVHRLRRAVGAGPANPDTTYRVVITSAVLDPAGNRLDQNPTKPGPQKKTWRFTTR